jgi:DNA-binding PadR family transcriptional regulator
MNTITPTPSPADVALLGLLAERPMHAWDIVKQIEYRWMKTWTDLGRSTVYKSLDALEARGLVTSDEAVVDGRARRTYTLTGDGRRALADGVTHYLATPEYPHWAIDIATYNVTSADPAEAVRALDEYEATLRERAEGWADLEEFLKGDEGCPPHRWALSRRARAMIEGELAWLAEFRAELAGGPA